MRSQIAFMVLAAATWLAPSAQALGPEDTEIVLDKGNIELSIIDGTTLSVGAGTHLILQHAKGPGEATRINVLKGQFRVSNVFHRHSGLVLIRAGDHAFELSRGAALISSTGSGPQATLLHGKSLGIPGAVSRLTTPGIRLKIPRGGGAAVRERPNAASINKMMNRVSGRKRPAGLKVRGPGVKRSRGSELAKRQPSEKQDGSRILKRSDIKIQTDKIQGAGLPPKPVKPVKPVPERPAARSVPVQPIVANPGPAPRPHDGHGRRPQQGGHGQGPRQSGQGQGPRHAGNGQRPRHRDQGQHPQHGGQGQGPRHGGMSGGNPRNPHPPEPQQPMQPNVPQPQQP